MVVELHREDLAQFRNFLRNLMMHGAGWMEGGLHASFEKMILDADLLQMVAAFLTPLEVSDEEERAPLVVVAKGLDPERAHALLAADTAYARYTSLNLQW